MVFFFCAYVWLVTSGREQMVIEYGKTVYQALVAWFDDAEVDFQMNPKEKPSPKKKSRRWD
jgi:hypothetical protein